MAPLGALTQAWIAAEAAKPLGWHLMGVWEFSGEWVALSEGPNGAFLDGSGPVPEQALQRLSDRLRERRGPTTG